MGLTVVLIFFFSLIIKKMRPDIRLIEKSAWLLLGFPQLRLTASAGLHDDDLGFFS